MKTYTLEIPEQHLSVIAAALSELPFKVAAPVIAGINRQMSKPETAEVEPAQQLDAAE